MLQCIACDVFVFADDDLNAGTAVVSGDESQNLPQNSFCRGGSSPLSDLPAHRRCMLDKRWL